MTRKQIAEELGVSYNTVQRLLKGSETVVSGQANRAAMIEFRGDMRPRTDVIRELLAEGRKVGDIARELDVAYQLVYRVGRAAELINPNENGRARIEVELDGEVMSRAEAIR